MAAEEYVAQGLTEKGRRDLVDRIAERGSRGYETVERTVAPSQDLAAAADAAVQADPVVLPPAAQAALAELTGAPVTAANNYAEAQRAIFARGQEREQAYGGQFYDDTQRQVRGHNAQLIEYATALQEAAEATAAAAARRRSSYAPSSSPVAAPVTEDGAIVPADNAWSANPTPTGVYEASPALHGPRDYVVEVNQDDLIASQENFLTAIPEDQQDDALLLTQAYPNHVRDAMLAIEDYIGLGYSASQTLQFLTDSLDGAGLARSDASRIAQWVVDSHASMFPAENDWNAAQRQASAFGLSDDLVDSMTDTRRAPHHLGTGVSSDPVAGAPPSSQLAPDGTAARRIQDRAADPLSGTAYGRLVAKYGLS